MKLGIAGTGKIVQEVLPVILEMEPEEVILMGRPNSQDRTIALCSQYHLTGFVLDLESLLATDVDTIYVALPNQLHYETTKKVILAGKHVILEKPATVHRWEWEELLALARENHKILVEAMSLHYLPAWLSLKERIPELGNIKLVIFEFCQYSSRYDAFRRGEIAPAFDPTCAGGALMDLNVYNLHAVVSLFGSPQSVQYHPNTERGVDTSGVLLMDYGSFQAVLIAAKDCQAPVASTIQGTAGCIRIPIPANQVNCYELWNRQRECQQFDFPSTKHRMYWEFREFFRAIREEDFAFAEAMSQISLQVMGVLEEARAL